MPTALAGTSIALRSPRRLEARVGETLAVELAFECDKPSSVPALVAGTAQVSDSRIDVHTPAGFPDAGAGTGYEVRLVAPGGLTVTYGHLARGSSRGGLVAAGESVGTTGN